jgi:Phosphoenolpyruvate synthase/pyruvate phosphate dikinase
MLIRMGIEKGRSVRPKLKVGICGEHGGDPASVKFCHRVGMNYVSSSPFRVPISRLAAAQAVVEETASAKKPGKNRGRPAKKASAVAPKKTSTRGRKPASAVRAVSASSAASAAPKRRGRPLGSKNKNK